MKELNEGLESYEFITHESELFLSEELTEDEEKLLDELGIHGSSRRKFLGQVGASGFGLLALQVLSNQEILAREALVAQAVTAPEAIENPVKLILRINGEAKTLEVDSRMTLLDALRERLGLTGTKKGCDHGQCGACTVHVNGKRVLSCLTLAATCANKEVTSIEGLGDENNLHPMQAAFIKYDAFQCGYCTPGQICSAVALLNEAKRGEASYLTENFSSKSSAVTLSDDEIRERMSGNLCRCGAYPNILKAIKEVHTGKEVAQTWNFAEEKEAAE
ncbi:MAG: (2Fe-2S)-binding protein [Pyrinomonadaceae bacterium]